MEERPAGWQICLVDPLMQGTRGCICQVGHDAIEGVVDVHVDADIAAGTGVNVNQALDHSKVCTQSGDGIVVEAQFRELFVDTRNGRYCRLDDRHATTSLA